MPQNALASTVALSSTNVPAPLHEDSLGNLRSVVALNSSGAPSTINLDVLGNLRVNTTPANSSLGLTAATVVKATPGRIGKLTVLVAGSAAGAVYDHASTSGVAAGNQIFVIPATAGVYAIEFPALVGITVVPGTGQTVSISFE